MRGLLWEGRDRLKYGPARHVADRHAPRGVFPDLARLIEVVDAGAGRGVERGHRPRARSHREMQIVDCRAGDALVPAPVAARGAYRRAGEEPARSGDEEAVARHHEVDDTAAAQLGGQRQLLERVACGPGTIEPGVRWPGHDAGSDVGDVEGGLVGIDEELHT